MEKAGPGAVQSLADGWTLAGTNIANVGGMRTCADGFYVIRNGRIARCNYQITSVREMNWVQSHPSSPQS
jgi:hypothetical protein